MRFEEKPGLNADVLLPVTGDLFHLAPIPIVCHVHTSPDREAWHRELVSLARRAYPEPQLEVPDVRHVWTLGNPPQPAVTEWAETHAPAIGVWHRVPVNQFLEQPAPPVRRLRELVVDRYRFALSTAFGFECADPYITESWLQIYKAGDYKVLHNHLRYDSPQISHAWAGAYYVDDGGPDSTMPYSGVFSFRIRESNYFFRPRAGLLLMWPADELHEVHPFYGSGERVVINFNISAAGPPKS